jgi:hypothetical protein
MIYKHAHAPRPRLPARHTGLQPVLDRMLAASPDERYQSASDLMRSLEAA